MSTGEHDRLRPHSFWRRHDGALIALGVCVLLALFAGYQWYAARVSHRNEQAAALISKVRPTSTCGQVAFLYSTVVRLMQHDPDTKAADLAKMKRQRAARVAACKKAP